MKKFFRKGRIIITSGFCFEQYLCGANIAKVLETFLRYRRYSMVDY